MVFSVTARPLAFTLRTSRCLSTLRPATTTTPSSSPLVARVGVASQAKSIQSTRLVRPFSVSAKAMGGGEGLGEDNVRPPFDK